MWTSRDAVESLGYEHVSHEVSWQSEYIELLPRRSQQQQQQLRCDRVHELCQHLDGKLRQRKRDVKRLDMENDHLRRENDRLIQEAKEQNMTLLSFAPLALHEASDCSLRHAGFMLPKFNGTDPTDFSEVWLKSIVDNAALFSWSENQTFLAAKMTLEGEARHWLVALRRDITNFRDFKVAFKNKYGKKNTSVAKVHLELAKRKKIKGEAMQDYVSDIKYLAKKIDLDDEDTLEYVMLGLPDDELFGRKFDSLTDLDDYLMEQVDQVRVPDEKKCYYCKKSGHCYNECQEYVESNVLTLFGIALVLAIMGV